MGRITQDILKAGGATAVLGFPLSCARSGRS
jgi:hypothetical protein